MPAIDAVILDLGNVLVLHDNALLFRNLGAQFGRSAQEAAAVVEPLWERINRGTLAGDALIDTVARGLGGPIDRDRFVELWNSHFTPHLPMLGVVDSLIGRTRLVLLSNTNALHFDWIRARVPLLDAFDALVVSHETGLAKPDRAIFERAVACAGTTADRTVFFDDLEPYVVAARGAGLQAHLFAAVDEARARIDALLAD